ncbi:hypothetical protein ACU4HD_44150 [Cupriavidus basilensis]
MLLARQVDEALESITVERPRGRRHKAPAVLEAARHALAAWLAVRAHARCRASACSSPMRAGRVMHAASVYRRVEALAGRAAELMLHRSERLSAADAAAMATPPRCSTQARTLLRWEYALGLRDATSAWRLRAAYAEWQAAAHPDGQR